MPFGDYCYELFFLYCFEVEKLCVYVDNILDFCLSGDMSGHEKVTMRVQKPQLNAGQPLRNVLYPR